VCAQCDTIMMSEFVLAILAIIYGDNYYELKFVLKVATSGLDTST